MAADILLHRATLVPVGKDQEQHLEIARDFASRFNTRYEAEVFPEPYPFNFGETLARVPALDGSGKMSKSENEMATLYLADDDTTIRKKIMKAKSDSGPAEPGAPMSDAVANLFQLLRLVAPAETVTAFETDYTAGTIRYGEMKKTLAEGMVAFLRPIREKAEQIQNDIPYLRRVMEQGAAKARVSAQATIQLAQEAVGLKYY
jgi:tryptophanyl-tRNA synthetase